MLSVKHWSKFDINIPYSSIFQRIWTHLLREYIEFRQHNNMSHWLRPFNRKIRKSFSCHSPVYKTHERDVNKGNSIRTTHASGKSNAIVQSFFFFGFYWYCYLHADEDLILVQLGDSIANDTLYTDGPNRGSVTHIYCQIRTWHYVLLACLGSVSCCSLSCSSVSSFSVP